MTATILACALAVTGFAPTAAAIESGAYDDPSASAAALPDASQPTTLTLNTDGSKDTDRNRTQQFFQFENGDWTGWYIRPGITAKFRITLNTDADTPNVLWAHRQAGRVDDGGNYALVRADDGGKLVKGVNEITYDTTGRKVGQVLLMRNDGAHQASVTIENLDGSDGRPSLGRYPLYVHDAKHPEAFWTYLTELRAYVDAGVDTAIGGLNDDPTLGMDVTSLVLGRMVYDLRAARMVDAVKDITTEEQATAWIVNANKVSNDRLDLFDGVLGFDADDSDPKQLPTRMKVVLEMTQNLVSPSSMFAWYTMYHLPESVWPGVATSVDVSHGWGNDHEYGHMLDIAPLTRVEETNNLISIWGRREAGIDKMGADGTFSTSTYHSGVLAGQQAIDRYLNAKAAGENPTSPWGDIWYDVTARFNVLRFFDDYDYSTYDYGFGGSGGDGGDGSGYTEELAAQVNKYGGLGAVYRQVRRTPGSYVNVGGVYDAAARAYSDALGFDMSEVMGRYGMPTTDATKEYTAKYPELGARVEYFSIDSDAKGINGAGLFGSATPAPTVAAVRGTDGGLRISASYPADSAEAKTVSGYTLLADGKEISWSKDGAFTLAHTDELPVYTVVAWDRRANPSPAATVPLTADVTVRVNAVDGADVTGATVHVRPDDPRKAESTLSPGTDGTALLRGIGPSTVTVTMDGYEALPGSLHVDTVTWKGGEIQFTLAGTGADATPGAVTPRPVITGVAGGGDGALGFTITDTADGADVYYTVDGSEPSATNGLRWNGGTPIAITSSPVTVRAIAYKAGMRPSAVASATFTDSRIVSVYSEIWGPSYGQGSRVDLAPGDYRGADALGAVYGRVGSVKVPDGLKVTLYTGENMDGTSYSYTANADWVDRGDPYNLLGIKSIKVETVKAPVASATGTVTFLPGADDATGSMADATMFGDVAFTVPDPAFTRAGWQATGWTDSSGKAVEPGSVLASDAGAHVTLTATWTKVTVRSITIATPPAKTSYLVGEAFDAAGLRVRAVLSDGTARLLESDDYTLQGFDASKAGTTRVTAALREDPAVTATFELTVAERPDTTAPTFAGVSDIAVDFGASFDALAGVSASDDRDGDVTGAVKVSGSVDTSKAGVYELTYTVADAAGNVATVKRVVTVKAKETPAPVPADYTKLDAAVKAADGKQEADYTADSWKPFADALAAAKAVKRDLTGKDGQTTIDAATKALTDATNALVKKPSTPECVPARFTDLAGASHAEDIEWLSCQKITEGFPNGDGTVSFGGMRTVVRQDMAAFLWRMAGKPYVDVDKELADGSPFTDVTRDTPHVEAILWLAKAGISTGYDNGDGTRSFGGMRTVVRQDMAAFLHRYAQWKGVAEPSGQAVAFTDVDGDTSHREDIDWLSRTGVTTGYDNGDGTVSFGGMRDVVRQDMAAFLHRMSTNVLK